MAWLKNWNLKQGTHYNTVYQEILKGEEYFKSEIWLG